LRTKFGAIPIGPANLAEFDRVISARTPLSKVPPINNIDSIIQKATPLWQLLDFSPDVGGLERLKRQSKWLARSLLRPLRLEEPVLRQIRNMQGQKSVFRIRACRGCLEECTYCAIRFAAGTLCSKPLDRVLKEFDLGLSKGYKIFEIIGEDLGPYGQDIGTTLPKLFQELFHREEAFKLIFTDINVRYVIHYAAELAEVVAANHDRIDVLKIPVQSGSDRMLASMRRSYTSADVKRSIGELLAAAPSLSLLTHVLVGFPGETEEDFISTVQLLRDIRFSKIEIYRYTDRMGTSASELEPKVIESIKNERIRRLQREFPQAETIP
jgi:threonylcarbamoyladenosine tRNA methylthiotransferase MtaB